MEPIKYGMFIMPFHAPDKPLSQGFDEDLELVVKAEELGFEEFWIGEHHTMKYETIVTPEIFIGRALGETQRIRLGPAPVCLNLHHPAYVASRLSFLDHLAKGRLNLCFGPGSVTSDQELYGLDPRSGGAMTEEAMDAILNLWTSDPPYEHRGKYWQFQLKDNIDEETLIGFIHKPLTTAPPAHRYAGNEPQLTQHANSWRARLPALFRLPDIGQCGSRQLADLRTERPACGTATAANRLENRPFNLSGRHHGRGREKGAEQFPGKKLRIHRASIRQGPGAPGVQARSGHARLRVQSGLFDDRTDHCG